MLLQPTETFFDKDGEIVCVTRLERINAYYYGVYCTGPKSKETFNNNVDLVDMEYGFGEGDIHLNYPETGQ